MNYQLIIKFYRKSLEGESLPDSLEGALKASLGSTAELDGFDTTPKEINLFVLTPDPRVTFRRANDVLKSLGIERGVSAAFRLVGGSGFTSIWPPRPMRKFTL